MTSQEFMNNSKVVHF
jgi:GTP-binding protein LepA